MGVAAVGYFEKKYPAREAVPFETVSLKNWVKSALTHLWACPDFVDRFVKLPHFGLRRSARTPRG